MVSSIYDQIIQSVAPHPAGPMPPSPYVGQPGAASMTQAIKDYQAQLKAHEAMKARVSSAQGMDTAMALGMMAGPFLEAAGPTTKPVSFAQAAGRGLPGAMQMMRQGPRDFLGNEAAMMKLGAARTATSQAAKVTAAAEAAAKKAEDAGQHEKAAAIRANPEEWSKQFLKAPTGAPKKGYFQTTDDDGKVTRTPGFAKLVGGVWKQPSAEGLIDIPPGTTFEPVIGTGGTHGAWKAGKNEKGEDVYFRPGKGGAKDEVVTGIRPRGSSQRDRDNAILRSKTIKPTDGAWHDAYASKFFRTSTRIGPGGEEIIVAAGTLSDNFRVPLDPKTLKPVFSARDYANIGRELYTDKNGKWKTRELPAEQKALPPSERADLKFASKLAQRTMTDIEELIALARMPGMVGPGGFLMRGVESLQSLNPADTGVKNAKRFYSLLTAVKNMEQDILIGSERKSGEVTKLLGQIVEGGDFFANKGNVIKSLERLHSIVQDHEEVRQEVLGNTSALPPPPAGWSPPKTKLGLVSRANLNMLARMRANDPAGFKAWLEKYGE